MRWLDSIQAHFAARRERSIEELYTEFALPVDVTPEELRAALDVFRETYGVSIGSLQSGDTLDTFAKQPKTHGPIDWWMTQAAFEDRVNDLNDHVTKGRKRKGASDLIRSPKTMREFVLAVVGKNLDER